jgi:hypothetical protein
MAHQFSGEGMCLCGRKDCGCPIALQLILRAVEKAREIAEKAREKVERLVSNFAITHLRCPTPIPINLLPIREGRLKTPTHVLFYIRLNPKMLYIKCIVKVWSCLNMLIFTCSSLSFESIAYCIYVRMITGTFLKYKQKIGNIPSLHRKSQGIFGLVRDIYAQ